MTSYVRIGGVLMIFSYLIAPAACANLLADSLRSRLVIGWLTATLAGVAGLYASFKMDLPTGAAIVCALGATLMLAAAGSKCLARFSAASRREEINPRSPAGPV